MHNAQSNVASLQSQITTLNAQVPKYDLVVAANNAYSAGVARRASVLDSAIDWPLVFNNLVAITPPGAKVQGFVGAATVTTGSCGGRHHHRFVLRCDEQHGHGGRRQLDRPHVGCHRDRPAGCDRAGAEPDDLRGVDQRGVLVAALRQPPAGADDGQP